MKAQPDPTRAWVVERNRQWSADLRQASLVGEIEVDDDDLDRAVKLFGAYLRVNSADRVASHDPAFFLVAMTAAGQRSWAEGTFYSKVAETLGVHKDLATDATHVYQKCLRRFSLPTFGDIGLRWVTPVLLHGTVPLGDLADLLEVLSSRRQVDRTMTGESFVEWARLSAGRLTNRPKAMTRFLEHGGDFAADFVGRVMDLADGEEVILPRRVTNHLRELLSEGHGVSRVVREARPSVALTLEGDIVMRLPPVRPETGRVVEWRVHLGDRVVECHVEVPWQAGKSNAPGATVSVGGPLRDVVVERDGTSATIPFVRSEDPLLVFDADGQFVLPTRPVPPGRSMIIWPSNKTPRMRDEGEVVGIEKDVPYGWEGWTLVEVDLNVGDALRLDDGPLHRVAGANQSRVVVGPVVAGLFTEDGREVTGALPVVELPADARPGDWTITVSDALGERIDHITAGSTSIPVLASRVEPFVGDIEVAVRGPLGRGVTRKVAVAAGVIVESLPTHRSLAQSGGLMPANVRIVRDGTELASVGLNAVDLRARVTLDGVRALVVEPPHIAFSLVTDGRVGAWTSEPFSLTEPALAGAVLRVRGLVDAHNARLVFRSGDATQVCQPGAVRRGVVEFRLAAFRDLVQKVGSGVIMLRTEKLALVVTVRPHRLIEAIRYDRGLLTVDALVTEPLELVLHRCAAPWEPGTALPIEDGLVKVPDDLNHRGPLRVQARVLSDWFALATDAFPRRGVDVEDIPMLWDGSREPAATRAISRALVMAPADDSDPITAQTMGSALEVLASPNTASSEGRRAVTRLVAAHPREAVQGVLRTRAATHAITLSLVESGVVSAPPASIQAAGDVEALLMRSPLAATLAASAAPSEVTAQRTSDASILLAQELGEDFLTLSQGRPDDAKLGRFEPEFASRPDQVKIFYDFLDPVPAKFLDGDTRIAAVYEMWQARSHLTKAADAALPTINVARKIIGSEVPQLWQMVEARLTQDGVIALPALSIALALIARIAAWREGPARQLTQTRVETHSLLARHAPMLTAIDLVRADAAVIGASR